DDEVLYQFYQQRLHESAISFRHLKAWYRKAKPVQQQELLMQRDDVLLKEAPGALATDFPDHLLVGEWQLPLSYSFNPQGNEDGLTVTPPAPFVNQAREPES